MIKYYSDKKQAIIDLTKESCDLETWNKNYNNEYFCCKHPNGFYVFLNQNLIEVSDEYNGGDPYTVIENLRSDFHQRRLNCTLKLIRNLNTNQGLKLLDLGCGQGHFTDKIKKEFINFDVYGLDYSISAIYYANSNFKDIDFIVADAYHPPYTDEYFDVIVCNNIWEHVPDPLNLLRAVSRILKPNGLLIISTPSRYRLRNLLRLFLGKEISFMSNHHVTEYTVGQIIEQLKYGGYKVSEIYSPEIKEKRLILRIIKNMFFYVIKLMKSNHVLEETVFYSSNKL